MNNKYNNKDYNYYGEGIPTANPTFWRMPDLDVAHANTARHRPTPELKLSIKNRKSKPEVEVTFELKEHGEAIVTAAPTFRLCQT